MNKRIGLLLNKKRVEEINEYNMDLISHSLEKPENMRTYIDRLMYDSRNMSEESRNVDIVKYKKAILLRQKMDIIKNNLFFNQDFPEFKDVQLDFFKNEYEALEKNMNLLSMPVELITMQVMKELVYKDDAKEYFEFLESKGYSSIYRILNENTVHSAYKINENFKESSLLLEVIETNKQNYGKAFKNDLFKTISYLISKAEIINEPGILTGTIFRDNPLTQSNTLTEEVFNFMHIPDVRILVEEYKKKSKEENNNFIYFLASNEQFKKSLSDILEKNKEMALKENLENILVSLFLEREKTIMHRNKYNFSVDEKMKYFDRCLKLLKDCNIVLSLEQKQSLVKFLVKDKKIEDIVLPRGWFKEFGSTESFKLYLTKDFICFKENKVSFNRNDLYEENKEYFIRMVDNNPKIIEPSLINTFENIIHSKEIRKLDALEINRTITEMLTSNDLYRTYFNKNENNLRGPVLKKMKALLKNLPKKDKNYETIFLSLSLFLDNPLSGFNNKIKPQKRL